MMNRRGITSTLAGIVCREAPDAAGVARTARLPFPASDPVSGTNEPLKQQWKA
jgi:hypothetical protein